MRERERQRFAESPSPRPEPPSQQPLESQHSDSSKPMFEIQQELDYRDFEWEFEEELNTQA